MDNNFNWKVMTGEVDEDGKVKRDTRYTRGIYRNHDKASIKVTQLYAKEKGGVTHWIAKILRK